MFRSHLPTKELWSIIFTFDSQSIKVKLPLKQFRLSIISPLILINVIDASCPTSVVPIISWLLSCALSKLNDSMIVRSFRLSSSAFNKLISSLPLSLTRFKKMLPWTLLFFSSKSFPDTRFLNVKSLAMMLLFSLIPSATFTKWELKKPLLETSNTWSDSLKLE